MKALILSPQIWGNMYLSKHHYAVQLVKFGYTVYFLETDRCGFRWNKSSFNLVETEIEGLFLVKQVFNVPYRLKFHSRSIFNLFIRRHIKNLEKKIGIFDLVWSFDLGNVNPLEFFSSRSKKIFFAADWPANQDGIRAARKSDLLLSVSKEILTQYSTICVPQKTVIEHGVDECFLNLGALPILKTDSIIRVGLAGNFLRKDLDFDSIIKIIDNNPLLTFEFFGTYTLENNNLGGEIDDDNLYFIDYLKNAENVILHGHVIKEKLAEEYRRIDLFLICYDVKKDQSKGTNYHKVLEFMAYGQPIVSNYMSNFRSPDKNKLVFMSSETQDVYMTFKSVLREYMLNFGHIKNAEMHQFARKFSYYNNTKAILGMLCRD